jgi:hypothetical protein
MRSRRTGDGEPHQDDQAADVRPRRLRATPQESFSPADFSPCPGQGPRRSRNVGQILKADPPRRLNAGPSTRSRARTEPVLGHHAGERWAARIRRCRREPGQRSAGRRARRERPRRRRHRRGQGLATRRPPHPQVRSPPRSRRTLEAGRDAGSLSSFPRTPSACAPPCLRRAQSTTPCRCGC